MRSGFSLNTNTTTSTFNVLSSTTEETAVTQIIMTILLVWSQRGTKVNGSRHHDNNPLLKPTGIQIATKFLPAPTTREHRELIDDVVFARYQVRN